jgi:hypothetical protein
MVTDNGLGTVVQSLDVGVGGEILSYFKQPYNSLTRQIPKTMFIKQLLTLPLPKAPRYYESLLIFRSQPTPAWGPTPKVLFPL